VSVQVVDASAARYFFEASLSWPADRAPDASYRQAMGIATLWLLFYLAALIF
jgi:hypothetical protein